MADVPLSKIFRSTLICLTPFQVSWYFRKFIQKTILIMHYFHANKHYALLMSLTSLFTGAYIHAHAWLAHIRAQSHSAVRDCVGSPQPDGNICSCQTVPHYVIVVMWFFLETRDVSLLVHFVRGNHNAQNVRFPLLGLCDASFRYEDMIVRARCLDCICWHNSGPNFACWILYFDICLLGYI